MKTLEGVIAARRPAARGGVSDRSKRRRSITPALSRRLPGLARIARRMWRLVLALELAVEVRRERRMLLSMDDRALKDIGLNRGEAYAEAHRPLTCCKPLSPTLLRKRGGRRATAISCEPRATVPGARAPTPPPYR